MANLLINTALRWLESKVPTSLMRFSDISQVTVLLDAGAEDAAEAEEKVKAFFAGRGIQLVLVKVLSGRRIKAHKETQVLLSLVPDAGWRLEYAVRRSRAQFKIGRVQLPGEPVDLVVSDPAGTSFPQTEVFERMMDLAESLK